MRRLGDAYAGLAEDSDKPRTPVCVTTERSDRPKCVKCGEEMRHSYSLPRTDTLRAMQAFCCDSCDETMICKGRITEVEGGKGPRRERVVGIRRADPDDLGQEPGAIPEQADLSAILDTRQDAIKAIKDTKTKLEGENKSRGFDAGNGREPRKSDRRLREHEWLLATREEMLGPEHPN